MFVYNPAIKIDSTRPESRKASPTDLFESVPDVGEALQAVVDRSHELATHARISFSDESEVIRLPLVFLVPNSKQRQHIQAKMVAVLATCDTDNMVAKPGVDPEPNSQGDGDTKVDADANFIARMLFEKILTTQKQTPKSPIPDLSFMHSNVVSCPYHCGEQKSRTFSPRRENTNNWNKKRREK
jgi:hypothetical protein